MDLYHIWCDLKDGREDKAFANAVAAYLDHHRDAGRISDWRLTRRKLGLAPDGFGEFHIVVETDNLAQLDEAFRSAASRTGEVERLHGEVYSRAANVRFALYRDWPDSGA